jgi:hypothetical protein
MVSVFKIRKQSSDVYSFIHFTLLDTYFSISIYYSYSVWSCYRSF